MVLSSRLRSLIAITRLAKPQLAQRAFAHDISHYKPGPYPKTPEERAAAAKKYNLLPEDYEPYPEEEGLGDYPKLPFVHNESRQLAYDYDYQYRHRNYGEPFHLDQIYTTDIYPNQNLEFQWSRKKHLLTIFGGMGFIAFLAWLDSKTRIVFPKKPKQYPAEYFDLNVSKKHYTFEPADD